MIEEIKKVENGFRITTDKGATDKPCGEGVRMLTQNCC